jgi:sterol 14-demethylase
VQVEGSFGRGSVPTFDHARFWRGRRGILSHIYTDIVFIKKYDVDNAVLSEQKRFIKHGLSPENLRQYVSWIEQETRDYFTYDCTCIIRTSHYTRRWKGEKGTDELSQAVAELTIMTASRCLMGKEVRAQLDETVADLYTDLDKGFTALNFMFPYLPLPSYRNRDAAHIKMRNLFMDIMKERRNKNDMDNSDMLQALMDCEYRNGERLTDREAACLMIALLMAGQHTSSTTGTWCLSYLAQHPEIRCVVNLDYTLIPQKLRAPGRAKANFGRES